MKIKRVRYTTQRRGKLSYPHKSQGQHYKKVKNHCAKESYTKSQSVEEMLSKWPDTVAESAPLVLNLQ